MAAALAFFALFALPPLVVTVVFVGDWLIDLSAAEGSVLVGVERTLGAHVRERLESLVVRAPHVRPGDVLVSLFGVGAFLFAAWGGIRQLQKSLNRIWGVERSRGVRYVLPHLLRQGASFLAIVLVAILLLTAAGTGALVAGYADEIAALLPGGAPGWLVWALEAGLLAFFGLFVLALLYKVVPDCPVPWRAAFGGALLAGTLLLLGRYPLALYLKHSWRSTVFGASGSIVGLLFGFYAVATILLLGGIASRVLADPPTGSGR